MQNVLVSCSAYEGSHQAIIKDMDAPGFTKGSGNAECSIRGNTAGGTGC